MRLVFGKKTGGRRKKDSCNELKENRRKTDERQKEFGGKVEWKTEGQQMGGKRSVGKR